MKFRSVILAVSVAVNLWLVWVIAGSPRKDAPARQETGRDESSTEAASVNTSKPLQRNAYGDSRELRRPQFSWSQLDSEDPRQFAANLKAVGCPEHVMQNLILELLCYLREEKIKTIPPCSPWADAGLERAEKIRIWRARQTIISEYDALGKELLGIALVEPVMSTSDTLMVQAIVSVLVGSLDERKLTECMMALERSEHRKRDFDDLPPVAAWREKQNQKLPWPGLPPGILNADQHREFSARAFAFRMVIDSQITDKTFHWTATELEHVSESALNVLPDVASIEDAFDNENLTSIRDAVSESLSPERGSEWRMRIDKDYRDVSRCLEDSPDCARLSGAVWCVKEQTEAAWTEALSNGGLSEAEREAQIRGIKISATRAVREILGPKFSQFGANRPWMEPEGEPQ